MSPNRGEAAFWEERGRRLAEAVELHRQARDDAIEARDRGILEADEAGYGTSQIARWFHVSATRVFQVISRGSGSSAAEAG